MNAYFRRRIAPKEFHSAMNESYPRSLRELEVILESTYGQLRQLQLTPVQAIDDCLMEDVAELVNEIAVMATYFNFPKVIPSRPMCTPLEGMRVIGRMLSWVRSERLRESPFLDIHQALRYIGGTSEKQIYGAVERGRLESLRSGKELRFTIEMLERFMQR